MNMLIARECYLYVFTCICVYVCRHVCVSVCGCVSMCVDSVDFAQQEDESFNRSVQP